MEDKLNQGKYETMEDFYSDVILITDNCRQFNPPTTLPYVHADELEAIFKAEWARVSSKLGHDEKRSMAAALNKLKLEDV